MNSRSEMLTLAAQKPDALIEEIERLRTENRKLKQPDLASVMAFEAGLIDGRAELMPIIEKLAVTPGCWCAYTLPTGARDEDHSTTCKWVRAELAKVSGDA